LRYPALFLSALLRHGLVWWVSLAIAYAIGGVSAFADYPALQAFALANFGLTLPDTPPLWWILIPFLMWVSVAAVHRETQRQLIAPNLEFDGPQVIRAALNNRHGGHDPICIVTIAVRNKPIGRIDALTAETAHATVTFTEIGDEKWRLTVPYPRWENNRKPRPDETREGDPIKFIDEQNFRTLEPNNAQSRIDVAIKHYDDEEMYGFTGASQQIDGWKQAAHRLRGCKWLVEVVVDATNMQNVAKFRFILESLGKDRGCQVTSFSAYQMQQYGWM
jgi:hypothetical protein